MRRRMRGQGMGWRGPDAGEMDDGECGCYARGLFTARGSGALGRFSAQTAAGDREGPSLGR